MTTPSEIEQHILRVALGDRAAFSVLYHATSAKLFGVCVRILNNRAEAEEVLQEAYIRVWQKADRYAANGLSPMTWLITLTRNLAIDRLRKRSPSEPVETAAPIVDSAPNPEAAAIATSERARIEFCLDELDDNRAEAVRGAYLRGETYQQLAQRNEVPLNTMRTWLRRSLLKLRECLSR